MRLFRTGASERQGVVAVVVVVVVDDDGDYNGSSGRLVQNAFLAPSGLAFGRSKGTRSDGHRKRAHFTDNKRLPLVLQSPEAGQRWVGAVG